MSVGQTILVNVLVLLIGGAIGWVAKQAWQTRRARLSVECENHEGDVVLHVTNGTQPVRVNSYGLGARTKAGYQDIALERGTLVTVGHKQDSIISLQPYAEERFRPVIDIGMTLRFKGVKAVDNKMRVRPYVRTDGRRKPYHGAWFVYDPQKRRIEPEDS